MIPITQQQIKVLRGKYKCLVQWCKDLQSYDYYIDNEVLSAEADNAPVDAIYKNDKGEWQRASDVQNVELRERLLALLK